MEPAADAQALPAILAFSADNHLFDRMEAAPGLDLEKDELIPAWWDHFRRYRLGFQVTISGFLDWIELKGASPVLLPELVIGKGHVENVGNASAADDIVVIEEMAAFRVRIDRHVLFLTRQRSAAGDGSEERTEFVRVERIAEPEEIRQEGYLGGAEVIERSKVACLIYLQGNGNVNRSGAYSEINGPCRCQSPSL